MEIGLLLLRLLLGGLLFGHAAQKMFGWFRGHGPEGTGKVFETWGFRPGKSLVILAAVCELTAAALVVLGLLTPLGAAIAFGTMLVAGSVNVSKGIWAQNGGYELPLVYGGLALGLGYTGPGEWSLDRALGWEDLSGAGWGSAALALGLVTGLIAISRASRELRRQAA
ncbi:DoxX family protein [Streptomyces sp. NPDC005963]|uniref:DoxX family protein n=1 Tax=Streptomyces sp. NPDC005963 TaxID=3156721 RepID=UPI00340AB887